jgi:hypothetical protein
MKEITINPKYTKTYKTKENLYKALDKLNLPETLRYLLCEVEGRFTAVFVNTLQAESGVWMNTVVHSGFKVVG